MNALLPARVHSSSHSEQHEDLQRRVQRGSILHVAETGHPGVIEVSPFFLMFFIRQNGISILAFMCREISTVFPVKKKGSTQFYPSENGSIAEP